MNGSAARAADPFSVPDDWSRGDDVIAFKQLAANRSAKLS